jgi:anti-anti-sigma factor
MTGAVRVDAEHRTFFLSGELDLYSAPALETAISEADWLDTGPVRFDLSELTFLDSSGLRAMTSAYAVGRTLVFASPTPPVRKFFEVVGYDSVFGIRIEEPAEV